MTPVLAKLAKKKNLSATEMEDAMRLIVEGRATDDEIENFLIGLRKKGETVEEIAAAAKVMRRYAVKLPTQFQDLLDTCGTGGDGSNTVNVSTLSSIVAVSAGARVAKHGNRSVSSRCGSFDVLELLGVRIDLTPEQIVESLEKNRFAFLFAPRFHPATKHAMTARQRIKGKTIFNLLGPLSNPAGASFQLLGVYEERLVKTMAEVSRELGIKRAMIVHGSDGLDEITLTGETKIAELKNGDIQVFSVTSESFGFKKTKLSEFQRATKEECLDSARQFFSNKASEAVRNIVYLNAGAAVYVAGKAGSIEEGIDLVRHAVESGKAAQTLDSLVQFSKAAA